MAGAHLFLRRRILADDDPAALPDRRNLCQTESIENFTKIPVRVLQETARYLIVAGVLVARLLNFAVFDVKQPGIGKGDSNQMHPWPTTPRQLS